MRNQLLCQNVAKVIGWIGRQAENMHRPSRPGPFPILRLDHGRRPVRVRFSPRNPVFLAVWHNQPTLIRRHFNAPSVPQLHAQTSHHAGFQIFIEAFDRQNMRARIENPRHIEFREMLPSVPLSNFPPVNEER